MEDAGTGSFPLVTGFPSRSLHLTCRSEEGATHCRYGRLTALGRKGSLPQDFEGAMEVANGRAHALV